MPNGAPSQEVTDAQQLQLLSTFHYVVAGLAALFACIPLIHLVLGLFMVIAPQQFGAPGNQPSALLGWFFVLFAGLFILAGWTFAVFVFLTGRFIAKRKHHTFCFVMACVECMFMPFGTVLGIFTIFVLMRQSVKDLFTPRPSL